MIMIVRGRIARIAPSGSLEMRRNRIGGFDLVLTRRLCVDVHRPVNDEALQP